AGDGCGQPCWCIHGLDACRRRDVSDGGESHDRRAVARGVARDGDDGVVDDAVAVAFHRLDAACSARRNEFMWALAAFLGVIVLGTLKGILVAIIISLVALGQQVADPPVHVLGRKRGTNVFRPRSPDHPDDETFAGLLLLRPEGRLFFLNAERIGEKIRPLIDAGKPKVVAFDLSRVFDLEYSALKMLIEAEKRQREAGVMLWLVGLNPQVYAAIQRSPLGPILGTERMMFDLEIAIDKFQKRREGG